MILGSIIFVSLLFRDIYTDEFESVFFEATDLMKTQKERKLVSLGN